MSRRGEAESLRIPVKGTSAEVERSNPLLGLHRTGAGLSPRHCRAGGERYCGRIELLSLFEGAGFWLPRSCVEEDAGPIVNGV